MKFNFSRCSFVGACIAAGATGPRSAPSQGVMRKGKSKPSDLPAEKEKPRPIQPIGEAGPSTAPAAVPGSPLTSPLVVESADVLCDMPAAAAALDIAQPSTSREVMKVSPKYKFQLRAFSLSLLSN